LCNSLPTPFFTRNGLSPPPLVWYFFLDQRLFARGLTYSVCSPPCPLAHVSPLVSFMRARLTLRFRLFEDAAFCDDVVPFLDPSRVIRRRTRYVVDLFIYLFVLYPSPLRRSQSLFPFVSSSQPSSSESFFPFCFPRFTDLAVHFPEKPGIPLQQ